jgi:phosphatidylserine decarboxylase
MLGNFTSKLGTAKRPTRTINDLSAEMSALDTSESVVIDNNNVQLLVQDRSTGLIVRENVPVYIKSAMRLMSRTVLGRTVTNTDKVKKLLTALTLKQDAKMNSTKSVKLIPAFIKTHKLNLAEVEKPISEYKTFNEFFSRRLKPGLRNDAVPGDDTICLSPADCRLNVFDSIESSKKLWIKGTHFTVGALLGAYDSDGSVAAKFSGGQLAIARLAPQDYHRWHLPVTCTLQTRFPIAGGYQTVNPIAVRKQVDVYTENSRVICPMKTSEFGDVILVAIGAAMVGSIKFDECLCHPNRKAFQPVCHNGLCMQGQKRLKFGEHGYFQFGGSTCLLLFQAGAVQWDKDLLANSNKSLETLVQVGTRIGISTGKYKNNSNNNSKKSSTQHSRTSSSGNENGNASAAQTTTKS